MSSNRVESASCTCFPFPVVGKDEDPSSSANLAASAPHLLSLRYTDSNGPRLLGKTYKAAVNGHISVASILTNAFRLSSFPYSSYAIIQAGKMGLTFSQIDTISKRLGIMMSSLCVFPGSDYQVSKNSDGDSVIMIILDDADYVDEQMIVLIFAIMRMGATYMVVTRDEATTDLKTWTALRTLIEPILVISKCDPNDLPTAVKNDLHLIGREQFEDFQEDDDDMHTNSNQNEEGSTTELNPFQASTYLVKKIRSSLILKPSTYLKPSLISAKLLWDLSMELNIPNERNMQVLQLRTGLSMGERTAFIFQCICSCPSLQSKPIQQWCRLGHKAIRNRICWERIEFPLKDPEKICLTWPLNDPRSLIQIFNCFINGKALILGEPGEFQSGPFLMRKFSSNLFNNVQRLELTPERLESLLDSASNPKLEFQLRRVKIWMITTTSSSPFMYSLAKRFFQAIRSNDVMLVITYGTPECLWCATWEIFSSIKEVSKCIHLEKDGNDKIFTRTPSTNTCIVVVDENHSKLCPDGQRGEICVVGSMIPTAGYCGSTILGQTISIFQTGDFGRIAYVNKTGQLLLMVDSRKPDGSSAVTKRKVMIQGKIVDLDEISKQIKQNFALVREAFAFICQRSRDIPEIVVAVVLKDPTKFETVKEMISAKMSELDSSLVVKSFPILAPTLPRLTPSQHDNTNDNSFSAPVGGKVDSKKLRAEYFKYLGKCNERDWLPLIPSKNTGKVKNAAEEAIEKIIQIICRAVAFSLGIKLIDVINNFEKSFWELGGSPIKAILTVKSCLCQEKNLTIEDFMMAEKISELGFRLVLSEKNETKWFHEVELARQFFIYSLLTPSDHVEIQEILTSNFRTIFPETDQNTLDSYSTGLIEIFDNSLSVAALSAENREMLGIAFNYRGNLKTHFIPPILEDGIELYTAMLNSCRHLTGGIENKNVAKSYMISLKTVALVHPTQVLLVVRDLVRESMTNAISIGCKGFMVCSQDPLVQEVCCSLLGFEVLSEIQLNSYRNKKFQKPFAHLDDHQVIGVYFAKFND